MTDARLDAPRISVVVETSNWERQHRIHLERPLTRELLALAALVRFDPLALAGVYWAILRPHQAPRRPL